MQSKELRDYGREVLQRDPNRAAAAEVLDLMAYLVECDFVGAEAKIDTIKYRFQGTKDEGYVSEAISLAKTDRKSTRLNSSHVKRSRMPSSA